MWSLVVFAGGARGIDVLCWFVAGDAQVSFALTVLAVPE